MPTLTIDNRTVTVPEGTSIFEAAKRLGLVIPHFCYHEALGAVGSCRLCAVKVESGQGKGIQMSCMVPVQDGMIVSTVDPEAVEFRAHVAEWSMLDHPHDCPVCDEGGECQLQEMTIAAGHGNRRYRGLKRTYRNQDLGPFVQHEMNRCIQCYRCVRTYRDYCGGTDYGTFGSRNRIAYGRVRDGRLESPFSGNIIDVCPTGVLTDKTFRYKCRSWDLQEAPSICPHCSLGCNTRPGGRFREMQRVVAGVNRDVNGFFICDRGRFGYDYNHHPQRLREPHVDGNSVDWPTALAATRDRVRRTREEHGSAAVAFLGSRRASLEANLLLREWAASSPASFECHTELDRAARIVSRRLGPHRRSLDDLRNADLIVLVGAEPLSEGPMLALAIRQAVRNGGRVVVLDPRPPALPCDHEHLPMTPEQLHRALEQLANKHFKGWTRDEMQRLRTLAKELTTARNPVLVGGTALLGSGGVDRLLSVAESCTTPDYTCGALLLLGGPNSYGAALLADGDDFDDLLDRMLNGTVKALVCLETDPFVDYPQHGRVQTALARLDQLIVFDTLATQATRHADIVLPTATPLESAGSYINNEGRLQAFGQVLAPGIGIRETGGGDHPPRTFVAAAPGNLPRPAWAVLAELLDYPAELSALHQQLAASDPRFAALADIRPGNTGTLVAARGKDLQGTSTTRHTAPAGDKLQLWPIAAFVASDIFTAHSTHLEPLRAAPEVLVAPAEAERRNCNDGERVTLSGELGHLQLTLRCDSAVPAGLALLPQLLDDTSSGFVPGSGPWVCTLEKEADQ